MLQSSHFDQNWTISHLVLSGFGPSLVKLLSASKPVWPHWESRNLSLPEQFIFFSFSVLSISETSHLVCLVASQNLIIKEGSKLVADILSYRVLTAQAFTARPILD